MSDDRFSLRSGERQVAEALDGVRRDHRLRYELMADAVRRLRPASRFGADIFCGTGYGTALLAASTRASMLGIDGSPDAIAFAEQHFSSPTTIFSAKLFPFTLPPDVLDFACLLESVEHVADAPALIATVARALRPGGIMLASTPNSEILNLANNPNPFHVRHYSPAELRNMLAGLDVLETWHQDVYTLNAAGLAVAALPEDSHDIEPGPNGQFMLCLARKPRRWFPGWR